MRHYLLPINFMLTVFALALTRSGIAQSQSLLIQHVHVIDVASGIVHPDQDIWVEHGKIRQLGSQLKKATDPKVDVLDGQGQWAIPGLVDAHIHLFQSGGLYTRPDVVDLTAYRSYELEKQWVKAHVEDILGRYLACGITTVIDPGGPMSQLDYPQRNAEGRLPNLIITGPLVSTYQPKEFQGEDPPIILANTPEDARKLVRDQLPHNPDFIKIWYIVLPGQSAEKTYPIVEATIQESHQAGKRVMVHATQLPTAKLALKAGADVLVHSVDNPIDQEFMDLLQKQGAVYIPTLIVGGNYLNTFAQQPKLTERDFAIAPPTPLGSLLDGKHLGDPSLDQYRTYAPQLMPNRLRVDSIAKANLRRLSTAGLPIATGTDAGNIGTMHASSFYQEIAAMQQAGLSPADILKASTLGGAIVADLVDEIGTLEPGKRADIVLLGANPLLDLKALEDVQWVIKDGRPFQPDRLIQFTPEELAQRQLNAYNARDIEAFLACYHDSVEVYNFPNQLRYIGLEKMRQGYSSMFEQTPDLHCELVNRIVMGNTVIDQESVTGLGRDQPLKAVAIYKIEGQKIRQVYFIIE